MTTTAYTNEKLCNQIIRNLAISFIDEKNNWRISTIKFINYNEVETIQFGSTCKNIILSHG